MTQNRTASSGVCQNCLMAGLVLAAALHFVSPLIYVTSDSLTLTYMIVGGKEDK